VESNSTSLDFSLLDVDFVPAKDDGDVLANTLEIPMPVGDILIRDSGGDVEHDDTALTLDVVSIAKATKLLLACSVPHVKTDGPEVGGEGQGVDFHTEGGDVFFFSNSPVK